MGAADRPDLLAAEGLVFMQNDNAIVTASFLDEVETLATVRPNC